MNIISLLKSKVPEGIKRKYHFRKLEKLFENGGYKVFENTGKTPDDSFHLMIKMYCDSNGYFNEKYQKKISVKNPPSKITYKELQGVPGSFTKTDFDIVNTELNKNGYVKFEKKLPRDLLDRIYAYALKTGAEIPPNYDKKIICDPANPQAEIYRFDRTDLVNNVDIQGLIMDPVLINIARNYLQCEPIFDFPAMWWSTSFSKNASSEAAQLYHFDMDRIKWLKIFFYINDVTEENGPHCYIQGTHKPGTKPMELLKRGYARISDEDLKPFYKPEDYKVMCGEAGTIFAGDTKCWHKGRALKSGHRLVLDFEYTSSLFGANYPKLIVNNPCKVFKDFCDNNKGYTSSLHLQ